MLTKAPVKELPEHAVYTDVITGGHLLPEAKKYTMKHFKALVAEGYSNVDARWIIICSNMYYHDTYGKAYVQGMSKDFDTSKFYKLCRMADAGIIGGIL